MSEQKKRNPLLGCFEISIFMRTGVNHFDGKKSSIIKSFYVVVLNLILVLATVPFIYSAQGEWQSQSLFFVAFLFGLKFIGCLLCSLFFVYYCCKIIQRKHNYSKFITTANWCSLIPLVVFLPFLLLLAFGPTTYEHIASIVIFISIYSYVVTAFVTRYVIDVPWELAGFIAICTMAINETGFQLLHMAV